MSPETLQRTKGKEAPSWPDGSPAPYALDNGAWTCYQKGTPFDVDGFKWAYERIGLGADWVVIPDSVGNKEKTLELAQTWFQQIEHPKKLIAVQDGMSPDDVMNYIEQGAGIFVGGSTEWKLRSLPTWGRVARDKEVWLHVGRVNTVRRIRHCQQAAAHSFDGTSATRFRKNIGRLTRALNQMNLWGEYDSDPI